MNLEKRIKALVDFQTKFKGIVNTEFTKLSKEQIDLRVNMYDEEAEEFLKAHRLGDKVEELDAICDEIFLTIGDAVVFGVQNDLKMKQGNVYGVTPKFLTAYSLMFADSIKRNDKESVISSIELRLGAIYAKAEALYGEDVDYILDEAMTAVEESNMSKLGDDGEPIYNEKGSKYYDPSKPEGKILKNPKTFFTPTERLSDILKNFNFIK